MEITIDEKSKTITIKAELSAGYLTAKGNRVVATTSGNQTVKGTGGTEYKVGLNIFTRGE